MTKNIEENFNNYMKKFSDSFEFDFYSLAVGRIDILNGLLEKDPEFIKINKQYKTQYRKLEELLIKQKDDEFSDLVYKTILTLEHRDSYYEKMYYFGGLLDGISLEKRYNKIVGEEK